MILHKPKNKTEKILARKIQNKWLFEYFEEEKGNGILTLSNVTGYPLGVVREAIENIFGTKIKTK